MANTNETMTALTTHNRGLYRLLDAKDKATAEKMRQSINAELERMQKVYAVYRATPLEDDERAAGDQYDALMQAYISASQNIFDLQQAGKLEDARNRLNALAGGEFNKARGYPQIMIDSNKRQIKNALLRSSSFNGLVRVYFRLGRLDHLGREYTLLSFAFLLFTG